MVRSGIVGPRLGGTFALLIRRQTRLSRGVKSILMTGITVTTLLTFVTTASAQNIFEALFGRLWNSPVTTYADPNAPLEFAGQSGPSIPETGQASAGMSPVAGQARRRSAPHA